MSTADKNILPINAQKILVLGYPKSGNTWLTLLLAKIFQCRIHDIDRPAASTKPNYYLNEKEIENINNDIYIVKSHAYLVNETDYDLVIQMVRDPRDVFISYMHYQHYIINRSQQQLPNGIKGKIHLYRFIKANIIDWKVHFNLWNQKAYLVKYEALQENTSYILQLILKQIAITKDSTRIDQAIEAMSFEKMSKRKKGIENKNSIFRKGVVGDYNNYFDFSHHYLIKRYIDKEMKMLNY